MKRRKKEQERDLTIPAKILLFIFAAVDLMPRPFESKTSYFRRTFSGQGVSYHSYLNAINYLEKKGLIKIYKDKVTKNQYIELTKPGLLETLFIKAKVKVLENWDGKWRVVTFDIPEEARGRRDVLRKMLKTSGFKKLQASVFINPYPFNREAISYLNESGLIKYIRIMKVEEMDNDIDLKKHFGLK